MLLARESSSKMCDETSFEQCSAYWLTPAFEIKARILSVLLIRLIFRQPLTLLHERSDLQASTLTSQGSTKAKGKRMHCGTRLM